MEEDRILNLVPHGMECGPFLVGYAQAVHDMRKDDEQFRKEAAKDILAGFAANEGLAIKNYQAFSCKCAIQLADELIKQLQEDKND